MFSKKSRINRHVLNPKSIRFRLTLMFVAFLMISLVTLSTGIYQAFIQDQQDEFDKALFNYATDIAENVDVNAFGSIRFDREILLDRGKIFPFLVGSSFVQVVDRTGNVVAKSSSLEEVSYRFIAAAF